MTDADDGATDPEPSPPGRIGTSAVGLSLSAAFFAFGAVNYYLIPATGGLASDYWNPILHEFLLNRHFLVLVYIPSIQLPLATVSYLRTQDRRSRRARIPSHRVVFGVFGFVAVVRVAVLLAETAYPWDAGSLQGFVDAVLFQAFVGSVGIPTVVDTIYVFYFPVAVLAVLLADRGSIPGHPEPTGVPTPRTSTDTTGGPDGALERRRAVVRGRRAIPGVPRVARRIPYWGLVAGVGLILVAGLATGGLEAAIGIASIVLSLYQLQPEDDL